MSPYLVRSALRLSRAGLRLLLFLMKQIDQELLALLRRVRRLFLRLEACKDAVRLLFPRRRRLLRCLFTPLDLLQMFLQRSNDFDGSSEWTSVCTRSSADGVWRGWDNVTTAQSGV